MRAPSLIVSSVWAAVKRVRAHTSGKQTCFFLLHFTLMHCALLCFLNYWNESPWQSIVWLRMTCSVLAFACVCVCARVFPCVKTIVRVAHKRETLHAGVGVRHELWSTHCSHNTQCEFIEKHICSAPSRHFSATHNCVIRIPVQTSRFHLFIAYIHMQFLSQAFRSMRHTNGFKKFWLIFFQDQKPSNTIILQEVEKIMFNLVIRW